MPPTYGHSSLTEENKTDLERVQKTATKIILGERYKNYEQALTELDLETLNEMLKICIKECSTWKNFEHVSLEYKMSQNQNKKTRQIQSSVCENS